MQKEWCFLIQLTFKLGFNRNNLLDFINHRFNFINNRFNFVNNRFNFVNNRFDLFDYLVSFDDYFLDFINYLNFKFFNFFYYLLDFIRYLLNYFLLGYAFVCFFNVFYKMQDDNSYLASLRVMAKEKLHMHFRHQSLNTQLKKKYKDMWKKELFQNSRNNSNNFQY